MSHSAPETLKIGSELQIAHDHARPNVVGDLVLVSLPTRHSHALVVVAAIIVSPLSRLARRWRPARFFPERKPSGWPIKGRVKLALSEPCAGAHAPR